MKIVIDIDNESYEYIKAYANEDVLPMGWYAISHGVSLTKVDCVSRTEAINELNEAYDLMDAERRIKKLKPVQPLRWQELKETIAELASNGGTGTQQDVCKFLLNMMNNLEKRL